MEIVSPSGRVYQWNKPTPPTAEDMAAIQAYDAAQGGASAPSAPADAGRTPDAAPAMPVAGYMGGMGGAGIGARPGRGTLSPAEQAGFAEGVRGGAAMGARVLTPLVAGAMSGGAGVLPTMAALGGAGATGELAAQGIEGQGIRPGEVAKAGVMNAIPVASSINRLARARGVMAAVGRTAEAGAKLAAGEAVGSTVQRSIEQGAPAAPYDSTGDAIRSMGTAAVFGAGLSGLGEAAGKVARMGAQRAERLATFAESGVTTPTLDMIWPSQAGLVNRAIARGDGALGRARLDAQQPLQDQLTAMMAGAPEHEAVFAQLRPQIGRLDAMRAEVGQLQQAAAAASEKAAAAQAAAQVAPEVRARLTAEATAAELNWINGQARQLHAQQQVLGDLLAPSTVAQQFTQLTDSLFAKVSEIGGEMFKASRVPTTTPLFPKATLVARTEAALAPFEGRDITKKLVAAIQNVEGDALTLNQVRNLRDDFAAQFSPLERAQRKAIDRAAGAAYGAVTEETLRVIDALPGADPAAYRAATGFWRDMAEAKASRYARPLLADEPATATFATLARDVRAGNLAEIEAFNRFVGTIEKQAPDLAASARAQLTGAVRNSFLQDATGHTFSPAALAESLLATTKKAPSFDIAALGFGTAQDIRQWSQIAREFKVGDLPQVNFTDWFSTPAVQEALAAGKPLADVMRPEIARAAFGEAVRARALYAITKNGVKERAAAAAAEKAAAAANLTLAERQAILAQVEADPVAQAFANGQTYGIPARPGGGIESGGSRPITSTILNLGPREGLALNRALMRTNPVLGEEVQRRVLADVMQDFFRASPDSGRVWALDQAALQRFFHPLPGSKEVTHAETLKALVGADRFAGLERVMKAVELLIADRKAGGIATTDGGRVIFVNSSLGRALAPGVQTLAPLRALQSMFDAGQFHLFSFFAAPPSAKAALGDWRSAFFKANGDVEAAINSMPFAAQLELARDRGVQTDLRAWREAQKPKPPPAPRVVSAPPPPAPATAPEIPTLTPEQAAAAPAGTVFRTTDGRTLTR